MKTVKPLLLMLVCCTGLMLLAGCSPQSPAPEPPPPFVGTVTQYKADGTVLNEWTVSNYYAGDNGIAFTVVGENTLRLANGIVIGRPQDDPAPSTEPTTKHITMYLDSGVPLLELDVVSYYYGDGGTVVTVPGSRHVWVLIGTIYAGPKDK